MNHQNGNNKIIKNIKLFIGNILYCNYFFRKHQNNSIKIKFNKSPWNMSQSEFYDQIEDESNEVFVKFQSISNKLKK